MSNQSKPPKRTILVVDDDPAIARIIAKGLARHGFGIVIGKNGHQAVKLAQQYTPDLIVMDLSMPGMDGLEACRIIKHGNPGRFIPIIFITGRTSLEDKLKGLDIGADDYITKPFEIIELRARIKALLRIKKLTETLQQTQQKLIEAKQIAALAAAAVTVSHQINTPLTRIVINTEMLTKSIPSSAKEKCDPYLDGITKATQTINALTKKFIKMSNLNFTDYLPGTQTTMLDID
jgi:DNA-binding response OmpR family regulator